MRASLLALVLLLALTPACEAAPVDAPGPGGFVEEFDGLDPQRWTRGDHALGRGRVDPANVRVTGGRLELVLPAGRLDGAEVATGPLPATGVATARLRVADAPGSLTGFFFYAPPDLAHEVDIEVHGERRGRVLFTTHAGGRTTHTTEQELGFDPTADAHEYTITRAPGTVTFAVDGRALVTWTDGVPGEALPLYLNAWFPTWLDGGPPASDRATTVERVTFTAEVR
ncbi:glycoside hydrolase family 16 protein [Actinomycetospora lemnae]|uniref:Glycoside hydrolase family 16 protein n=1 Tax=Actinomycetospora lemnae TaxID=3019891 RepID=A0ABT5SNK2_9PSEU|nr:glycoside hydrolase family 16 protein [Actinomycetospora sp. DW7H6]MDD7964418.1 glycoside hydrolase family 16 protein [Actinomycetospora sp. DW7H6]